MEGSAEVGEIPVSDIYEDEARKMVEEDFERWREARHRGVEREARDQSLISAWAKVAWSEERRAKAIGRELAKLQARISRQRAANRALILALKEANADGDRATWELTGRKERTMTTPNPNPAPDPKVVAAGVGGAVTTIIIWLLVRFAGVETPPDVAAAIATLIAIAAGYLSSRG